MFSKILVANRGEIAVRIIRACREMGIITVAVYSEADRESLHVNLADESYCIGSASAKESYLNMNAILSVAINTKSEAIHPGYGLLSENARFAELCQKCNIIFIGPSPELISRMGNKDEARRTMKNAGVPVIPGSDVLENIKEAEKMADEVGYPLLIKARSGGGGRGIRLVRDKKDFAKNYLAAQSEAESAFSDGALYLERYLSPVKHIEIQILCDNYGNVVCLGERECSLQRKNQKILEESPSPSIDEITRNQMIQASINAAKAVGYKNAGTIEYLYDERGNFYFMEMNTRLQVEHPVTEFITGKDLVKWQIRIAAGQRLNFSQRDIKYTGAAIECRINAEDPYNGFKPGCGRISLLHIPGGPWVRFDTYIYQNYEIPPFYDSMIGKLVVHAQTREEAIRKMKAALCELIIEGVASNSDFQLEILGREEFISGEYNTKTIDMLLGEK